MKQIIHTIFMIIVLLAVHNSFGYFYQVCVVKKNISENISPQYIVLLADYHDKNHYANEEQRVYFESLLKKYSGKNIKLIIEDLSSVNNDGRMICGKYGINCTQSVLGHLACKARSCGFFVDNIEYRYCRVAGIGPLINNIGTDPQVFKSSCIPLVSIYKEIIEEIEKIKKYDDGKKLNDFYKKTFTEIITMISRMRLFDKNQKKTIGNYCAQLHSKKYREQLENLCIFDSGLIDCNIVHSVVSCDASTIFVLAGGSHIEQVKKVLQKNGYQQDFVTPSGSRFQPIDISLLDAIFR